MKTLEQLVKEFFVLMDKQEESDSGNLFKPNQISSCRVMDGVKLEEILQQMKDLVCDTHN